MFKNNTSSLLLITLMSLAATTALADDQETIAIKGPRQVAVYMSACEASSGFCDSNFCLGGPNIRAFCDEDSDCPESTCSVSSACSSGRDFGAACAIDANCRTGCFGLPISWHDREGQLLVQEVSAGLDDRAIHSVTYSGHETLLYCDKDERRISGSYDEPVVVLYNRRTGNVDAMSNDG